MITNINRGMLFLRILISRTHQGLEKMIEEGKFLMDLQTALQQLQNHSPKERIKQNDKLINQVLDSLRDYFLQIKDELQIKRMGLFGSIALRSAGTYSDMDVIVEFQEASFFSRMRIKHDLEDRFGITVDVIRYRDSLSPLLKKRIDRDAIFV